MCLDVGEKKDVKANIPIHKVSIVPCIEVSKNVVSNVIFPICCLHRLSRLSVHLIILLHIILLLINNNKSRITSKVHVAF